MPPTANRIRRRRLLGRLLGRLLLRRQRAQLQRVDAARALHLRVQQRIHHAVPRRLPLVPEGGGRDHQPEVRLLGLHARHGLVVRVHVRVVEDVEARRVEGGKPLADGIFNGRCAGHGGQRTDAETAGQQTEHVCVKCAVWVDDGHRGVYARHRREIDLVKTHFPHDDLVFPDETVVLPFPEAVALLNASGWTDAHGHAQSPLEDLSTPAEIRLGQLVKEKYNTDYYILDKFPRSARPFYAHLDATDPRYTNSFDIFLRGQEITTGGQRIHNPDVLKKRMAEAGIDPAEMQEYVQGFELGVLPHAGCGIGLERLLFLMLDLKDVRNATLFPRDPKSFPVAPAHSTRPRLTHPEADTIQCALDYEQHGDVAYMPTIEELIANYGDATNTSWLDDRYAVWRHRKTGAAVGYAQDNGYAIIMGNPLCDPRQYAPVMAAFLEYVRKEKDLRPLWLLVSSEVAQILSTKLGWNSLSCVAEERVAVDEAKRVRKKERQAEEAGVTVHVLDKGEPVPDSLREACDKRIVDWKANRHGRQVHITEVRPWVDLPHRRFVWAEDAHGTVAALIVLHDLAPAHGCQIKFALNFPGAPNGAIELAISRAIAHLASAGIKTVTFGAGATQDMEFGPNLQGTLRAKILSRTYKAVAEQLRLHQKSEFREKFGAVDEPVYICYPHLGLGVSGVRTLIKFFEDEM